MKSSLRESGNFLQSEAWMKANELVGHKTIREVFARELPVYMIVKDAKRGRYLEIPGGPLIDYQNEELVREVFARIREIGLAEKCVFVRLRPQLLDTEENRRKLANLGCRIAPMHLHAEHTVILDLEKSEDELLAEMRRQTRYEVRRALKQEIVIEKGNSKELFEEFHRVQKETAERQHFIPPSRDDLMAEREAFLDDAVIYVAKTKEGEAIAYGLILKHGVEADYFEAASTELNRKMPGAYALQWQVIRDMKNEGFLRYNLWGIAPPNQPNHRYAGVTTFKTGFGGECVTFVPAHDIVLDGLKYKFDLLVETVRKKRRKL